MQTIICDACGKSTESPIAVEWDRPDADDDDIVWGRRRTLARLSASPRGR